MTDSEILELSNDAGIAATLVLSFNFSLGMLLGVAYKRNIYWKKLPKRIQQADINNLHNWTAYVALVLVLVHPLLLLFARTTKFTFLDIIFPVNAPHQKLFVLFGTLSLIAVLIVILTTQKAVKKRMSFRAWKNVHLISYITAILFIIHGTMMDPQLKDRPVDFFDGEKLLSELCGAFLIIATIIRYKYHLRTKKGIRSVED